MTERLKGSEAQRRKGRIAVSLWFYNKLKTNYLEASYAKRTGKSSFFDQWRK